jgi:hypothetical protein
MKINQKHIEKPKCRKGEAKKRGKNKNLSPGGQMKAGNNV